MKRSLRTFIRASAFVAIAAPAIVLALSPSMSASLSAAVDAFVDPSRVHPSASAPVAQKAPARAELPHLAPLRSDAEIDAELARELAPAPLSELDDGTGASLERLSLPELRVPITRRTMRYVRFFTTTVEGRAAFADRLTRLGRYREIMGPALREAGLPEDLVWVAAVESGLDPRAVSKAGATGLWQFMPETGRMYGLDQSPWVDERKSLVRSTSAAVTHLRDLFERFGRWDLALAAYNLGSGGVVEAIDKVLASEAPGERREPIGLADLAQKQAIPRETANYVPQISALAIVAVNRARFGLDAIKPAAPVEMAEIVVPEGTRLSTLARAAGVPASVLRDLNPELLQDRVPPSGGDMMLHIPADRMGRTIATFPSYSDNELMSEGPAEDDVAAPPAIPLGAAVAFGPGFADDSSLDDPLAGGGDAHAMWASLGDSVARRPRFLGQNRLPDFFVPSTHSGPIPLPDGMAFAALTTGAPWSGAGLVKLTTPEMLEGRVAMILDEAQAPQQRRATRSARDTGPLFGGILAGPGTLATSTEDGRAPVDNLAPSVEPAAPARDFLAAPTIEPERFTLSGGTSVSFVRDATLPDVAITLRVRSPETMGPLFASESSVSFRVARRDLDVGAALAAARLSAMLGESSPKVMAELRRRAAEPQRALLAKAPYGAAWLALGEALFPAGSPLEGRVIGARDDKDVALDLLMVEAIGTERKAARASLSVVGDVPRDRLEKLLEASVGRLAWGDEDAALRSPLDERIEMEADVPDTRALYGFLAPAEGSPGDAATRVAAELLFGKRGKLRQALVEDEQLVATMRGQLDLGRGASVVAIELTPAVPHDVAEVETRMHALLEAFTSAPPSAIDTATAKALIRLRLLRERDSAEGEVIAFSPRAANSARVRRAIEPEGIERVMAAVDGVTPEAARKAAEVLSAAHQVVVITVPSAR